MFDVGSPTLTPTCTEYINTIREMCGENIYARLWLEQVIQVALVWDHHIDEGDKKDPRMFNHAMTVLVTEWPLNPFLRKNAECLIPTVVASISAWKNNESRDLHYSVYREVPCSVAFVLGGNQLVEQFMPRISELAKKMAIEDDIRDKKETTVDA